MAEKKDHPFVGLGSETAMVKELRAKVGRTAPGKVTPGYIRSMAHTFKKSL